MNGDSKVTAEHRKRTAYLYIRQSTLRQVFENTESTHRQYALRQRAIALGWPEDQIVVIDCDQAQSGASALQRVALDPDRQVQETLRHFFETFRRCGSAWSTVAAFRKEGLKFPKHGQAGSGEAIWEQLRHGIALDTLHNPRYAGAFCYGRSRTWKDAAGHGHCATLPREQWTVLLKEAHPGYITWEAFEENQQRLRQNQQAPAQQRRSPPREGPGLLQGLVICGQCGRRMTVRYHQRRGELSPNYVCQKQAVEEAQPVCQDISGGVIDEAVGKLIIESVSPLALEVSLQVQQELQSRLTEADHLRCQQVERAQYESDQARVRFMRVDPNHRLVADTLEGLWNEKLRHLAQVKEDYEKQRQADRQTLTPEQRQQILALAQDIPKLWQDPKTSHRDRKRMARLLVEDVTLKRDHTLITAQVRFKGGATRVVSVPAPLTVGLLRKTKPEILAEIVRLLDTMTDSQIAAQLNQRGWGCSVNHHPFTARAVLVLRCNHKLTSLANRLRAKGLLNIREMAEILGTKPNLVDYWREQGLLRGFRLNDKNEYMYEQPNAKP